MLLNDSYIAFVNLSHRVDRLAHMNDQLSRVGIQAERVPGLLPSEVDVDPRKVAVMQRRTPGAIGCHYSQVSIMEKALRLGKHAFIMEDDLIFCEDFELRLAHIDNFCHYVAWDVFCIAGEPIILPFEHFKVLVHGFRFFIQVNSQILFV